MTITITMTLDQTAMYLSSAKAGRQIAIADIKAQIRAVAAKVGTPIMVLTAGGVEAWRDAA